jgi:hypothetical protein
MKKPSTGRRKYFFIFSLCAVWKLSTLID